MGIYLLLFLMYNYFIYLEKKGKEVEIILRKFYKSFIIFILAFFILLSQTATAGNSFSDAFKTVESNKTWTIAFNQQVVLDNLTKSAIYVSDDSGNSVKITYSLSENEKSIFVGPPIGGYTPNKIYNLNIGTGVRSKDGKNLKDALIINFTVKTDIINGIIILPKTDYDKLEAQAMIDRLSRISPKIIEKLIGAGVKIKLINGIITDEPEYTYLVGVTPRGWEGTGKTWDDIPGAGGNPTVVRIGYSSPSSLHGHGAINLELHETAHAVDWYIENNSALGRISKTLTFISLWKKEVKSVFGDDYYFNDYSEEYFAETFAMYYLNQGTKNDLKEKAPLTYEFLQELDETGDIPYGVGYNVPVKRESNNDSLFIIYYWV